MTRSLRHVLILLTAIALVMLWSGHGRADDTWCVGGFTFDPKDGGKDHEHGCYAEGKNRGVPSWHWHNGMFVTKDGKTCYSCWDQVDNTCESHAPGEGWKAISASQCATMDRAKKRDVEFVDPRGQYKPKEDPMEVKKLSLEDMLGTTAPPPKAPEKRAPPPIPVPVADDPIIFTPPPLEPAQSSPLPPILQPKPPPAKPEPGKPPPPRPKPSATPQQVYLNLRVSAGPYAVNDPITATGTAYTAGGRRPVNGGVIAVYQNGQPLIGPDGQPVRFVAQRTATGQAAATFSIPAGGNLTLRFVPDEVEALKSEKLIMPDAPADLDITVASCRLRGDVLSPTDGELVAAADKSKVRLRGQFMTTAGSASSDLGGAAPFFEVDVGGVGQKVPATADGSDYVGEVEVDPPRGATGDMTVRLYGDGGQNDVCPGKPASARLTRLGVALALEAVKNCYVDRPCEMEARFVLPQGDARAAAEAFASAPDLVMELFENATKVATLTPSQPGNPETVFTGTFTPRIDGTIDMRARAASVADQREVQELLKLVIKQPIVLALPPLMDLGTIAAGSAWPAGCQILDFSTSRGVIEQGFQLVATEPEGCDSTPALASGGLGHPLPGGPEIFVEFGTQQVQICLAEVPRCSSENPKPIVLTVKPKNPDFADQVATLQIKWRVEGRNFLACHWWWIAAVAGGLFLLFLGYGFVKPYNFSPHDTIRLASERKQLNRAVGRRLRELPGGRSGWYRSASTGIRDDGSATDKPKLAAVLIRAHKGEVYLESRGALERVHPGTKKLEPLDTGDDGVPAAKGVVYRVGNLYFQIG